MEPQPTPTTQFSEIELWRLMGLSHKEMLERATELQRYHQQRLVYFQRLFSQVEQEMRHAKTPA